MPTWPTIRNGQILATLDSSFFAKLKPATTELAGRKNMIEAMMAAFELANVEMLVIAMPEAVVKECSTALLRKWNCQRSDVVGKPLLKFGTGTLSARHLPREELTSAPTQIEVTFAPPLGSQMKSVFRNQPLDENAGQDMLLVGHASSAEQSATAVSNEKRLSLALRSGGYALWDYNFETGESYNSPELIEAIGPDEHGRLDFHSFNERVHPDDRDKTIEEKIRHAPFGTDVFQTRYRVKVKSGHYAWIESVAGLIRDPGTGKPSKCVGLCRNVDDQMMMLERLKSSEIMLKRTQSVSHIGSFKLRVESGVSRLTAEMAALIGLADAMVHPTLDTFIKMMEPGDKEKFNEAIELAKLGKQVKNIEVSAKLKSGQIEFFQINLEPETNSAGEIEHIFGACQCVTERKALEGKFHQAQKMEAVGQLTGGIAHDFNNLLMVVMGNLQLVEQLVTGDERATKRIRAAIEAADKGSDLTRRMLAFSRQQTLQNAELQVNGLLQSIQDMLKQALSATVELSFIGSPDLWDIKADRTMLETAVLNLVINARDAMAPHGGKLIIETANRALDETYCQAHEDLLPGDYVEIAVTDTGTGIAPENIEKVFQPFFTTKAPEAGSGLGLSMIYGFVKQSGGHVKIYSELGHGTAVKLYLPRMKSRSQPAPPQHPIELQKHIEQQLARPAPAPTDRKLKVLVVEDNSSVREVAAAMIEEMGFEVITAVNGPDGLAKIQSLPDIDLVLSDVIMAGGMNGPELATRAIKFRPDLKILFMSGYAPGSVRQMQDLPDSIDLVNKPFTRHDLTEKVQKALNSSIAA
jgi:signal transduction histidine kinase